MARKLFERIAILLKADAHGLVESLEERALLLKQYLREAECALDEKRARVDAVREDRKRLDDVIAAHEGEIRALDEDVGLALGAGKDDLARFALRRLIPRRKELAALRRRLAERVEELADLTDRLARQQEQLDALRTRVRAELAREPAAPGAAPFSGEPVVADEEVELELMRRRGTERGER
jgi:phage shock protein A